MTSCSRNWSASRPPGWSASRNWGGRKANRVAATRRGARNRTRSLRIAAKPTASLPLGVLLRHLAHVGVLQVVAGRLLVHLRHGEQFGLAPQPASERDR